MNGTKKKSGRSLRSYFMFKPKRGERVDFFLFALVFALLCFGLIMLYSASLNTSRENIYSIILRQLTFAGLGLAVMFVTSRIDYHIYKRLATPIFWVTLALMYLVPLLGFASHGATRQISIAGINFQPSEICKFAVVIYFAALLTGKRHSDLSKVKNVLRYVGLMAAVAFACILQSHLSAMILITLVGIAMLFAAGLSWKYLAGLGGAFAVVSGVIALVEPYRVRRLLTFLHPFEDPRGDGWQVINSLYAVGSGGLTGVGFGQSRQKYGYLPEAQNDYIYAIVCEELGFLGGMAVLVLFALLIFRGVQIAFSAKDNFGLLLGFGIIVIVALQVIISVSVVLSVFPSTGMQLPFFSSGGTSLIIMMAGMGILMNISRFSTQNKI